ncbi:MAG TPA: hypothetical protein VGB23_01180 [Nitrospirota bacterium]
MVKRLLRSSGAAGRPRGTGNTTRLRPEAANIEADDMVQDPHCKVYVPMSRAVSVKAEGQTLYFCSEDCAHKYVNEMGGSLKKRA